MPPYHPIQPTCHPERKHHAQNMCEPCYHSQRMASKKTSLIHETSTYTDVHWAYRLKHFYNMTADQYNKLNEQQHGLCAICENPPRGKMKRLSVDHDHTTGKVRGLLCITCNRSLGWHENDEWSMKANKYLGHSVPNVVWGVRFKSEQIVRVIAAIVKTEKHHWVFIDNTGKFTGCFPCFDVSSVYQEAN